MNIGMESEKIEFKKTTGEKKAAMQAICAMLNKNFSGELYFGVDDNGNVLGQQVSDNTIKDISQMVNEAIEPKIITTIEILSIDEKNIIKVSFSGHNRPYSCYGDYLIRTGSENRKMTTDELRKMIKNDDYSSKWEEEETFYTIEDIDYDSIYDYYNSAKSCNRLNLAEFDISKILTMLTLLKNNHLKNAAYALFGKKPNIGLKLATFATDSKTTFLNLKLLNGNIYNLVNEAVLYINKNLNYRVEIGKIQRIEIPEIPLSAIREIVVNAFAHALYEKTAEIEINVHPNKICISNPGSFPDDLTPIDFIDRNISSYKRNPLILDVLFRSKDVEKSGTGFQRVNELCKENKVKWLYEKSAYGFTFIFIRNTNTVCISSSKTSLSTIDKLVYNTILNDLNITKASISCKIGKSEKTIQRSLTKLIQMGYLNKIGNNRNYTWEILKNMDDQS